MITLCVIREPVMLPQILHVLLLEVPERAAPDDEFADPSIGPCDRIIDEYIDVIREMNYQSDYIFEEPILVNKMACGEYLILNGHHRWAAALKAGLSKVRASLVNP